MPLNLSLMQGRSESIGWAAAFEFTPAAIFGSAVVFATATWAALPPLSLTPAAAGAAAFGGIWLALNRFGSTREQFSVPEFDSPGFHAELSAVSELLEQADVVALVEQLGASVPAAEEDDELILEDVLERDEDSRVVRLFQPNETAGEMHDRVERHLQSTPRQTPLDATQELHDALAALRRSLR